MVEIIKNVENKLLSRKEILAKIPNTGSTPSRADIRKELAKKLKADESLIVINLAQNYFGDSVVNVRAKVYDTKEALEKYARPHMVKRNTVVQEAAEEVAE